MRALATATVVMAALGCDCPHVGGVQVCGPTDVTVPITHAEGWPVVEGSIDGTPARFLLDTGAGGTIVSEAIAGASERGWRNLDELCLGELCMRNVPVWAENSEITPPTPGPDRVDGVLGTNVLRSAVLELDRGEAARIAFGGTACAGEAIDVTLDDDDRPFAPIRVQGVDLGEALLDTGALYVLLADEDVTAIGGVGPTEDSELCTLRSCRPARITRVDEVCVADMCEPDIAAKIPAGAVVGASFWNRAHYAFDLAARRLTRCE